MNFENQSHWNINMRLINITFLTGDKEDNFLHSFLFFNPFYSKKTHTNTQLAQKLLRSIYIYFKTKDLCLLNRHLYKQRKRRKSCQLNYFDLYKFFWNRNRERKKDSRTILKAIFFLKKSAFAFWPVTSRYTVVFYLVSTLQKMIFNIHKNSLLICRLMS